MLSVSNAIIGYVSESEDPITRNSGCLDKGTLANLEFTNIQSDGAAQDIVPGDQDQGVLFLLMQVGKPKGFLGPTHITTKGQARLDSSQATQIL